MAVLSAAAYGMYSHDVALRQVVQTLTQSEFQKEDICMMVSPKHPLATAVREANVLLAERGACSATAGMMAWLMKFGAVMIPKVGLFIRSAAFLDALMSDDASRCGNSNGLVQLGFSREDADRAEAELGDTGVLVYIACTEKTAARRAVELLRLTGAREASVVHSSPIELAFRPEPAQSRAERVA